MRNSWWRHKEYVYVPYDEHRRACRREMILGIVYGILASILLYFVTGLASGSELALGDSLAVGFGQASRMPTRAVVGISSCRILQMTPTSYIDFVLVSAGTNDPPGPCVRGVRNRLRAGRVEWVVPVNGARSTVLAVAAEHGDSLLYYTPSARGWPHPAAYFDVHTGVIGLHRERLGPPPLHHLHRRHHLHHHRRHHHAARRR